MSRDLVYGIVWGAALLAVALGASVAREVGAVDADTVTRLVLGSVGLALAWYGNRIPKAFVADAYVRGARRVAGWCMALSGLVYAGAWAFAPLPLAWWIGPGAVLIAFAITVAYCFSLPGKPRSA